jgi:cytoskeletal protein RodZ
VKKVLYINNDEVKILLADFKKGETKVIKSLQYTLEPGSVINGVLIKTNEILNILKGNSKLLKNATVVLNSSNIQIKKLDHPELKGKQFDNYIKKEFSIPEDTSIIYGSTSRKIGNQYKTIFMGVPVDIIKSYLQLFEEAKIKLGRFEILQNGMAKFVKNKKDLEGQTFVLNLIEGNNLISVLMEAGEYVLTERSRLMAEPGSDQFLDELLQKISSLVQFNKSQKSPYEIAKSYYVGLPRDMLLTLEEKSLSSSIGLEIVGFIDDSLHDRVGLSHFCCFMGMLEKKSDINLMKQYKKQVLKNKKRKWGMIAILLALIVVIGGFTFVKFKNILTENENRNYESEISETANAKELAELIDKQNQIMNIPEIVEELNKAQDTGADKDLLNASKLLKIMEVSKGTITISSIEGNGVSGSLVIDGTGSDEFSTSSFISKLKETELFTNVQYSGYTSTNANEYSFTITCILK